MVLPVNYLYLPVLLPVRPSIDTSTPLDPSIQGSSEDRFDTHMRQVWDRCDVGVESVCHSYGAGMRQL